MIKLSFPRTIKPAHMIIGCLVSGLLGFLSEPLIFSKNDAQPTASAPSESVATTPYSLSSESMPSVITPREKQEPMVDLTAIEAEQLPPTILLIENAPALQYAKQKYIDLPKGTSLKPLFTLNEAIVCQDQTQDSVLILKIEKTDLHKKIGTTKALKSSLEPIL